MKKKRKNGTMQKTLARLGLLALLPAVAAACSSGRANENELTLENSVVERKTIEASVEATGTIEPIKVVEVKSQASGEIFEVHFELGDRVDQGDLLIRIDPRDVQNELEQAEADLTQAEAQLQVARSRLERARALRDSGVVTEEELENAILEHANAQSSFQRARSQLQLAQDRREDATIAAPITGTVIEKIVEEGQVITSTRDVTGGTTLLRMADLSEVQVRTLVDESDIGRVQPGQPAGITVEAYPDRDFRGEVLKIEPQATVEQNVTMFAVLNRIENEEQLLRPGMNGDVEIVLGRRENVLALPNSGVKMPGEARRLVEAIGMDESLLDQEVAGADSLTGGAPASGSQEAEAQSDDLPSMQEIRSMSQSERRELFQSLSADQRQRLMGRMQGGAGRGQGQTRRPTGPRKAFVFVRDERDRLTLRPVLVGMSSWEETEIVAGLAAGDTVVEVPLALVQQSEMMERVRSRTGLPGVGG